MEPPPADRVATGAAGGRLLLRGAFTIAALSALFGAVSLLRDQATAYLFGSGPSVEAFVVAFAVPVFLINTVSGVLAPVFTPILMRIRHQGDEATVADFFAAVLSANAAVGVAVCLLLAIAAPVAMPLLAPGFDQPTTDLAIRLLYWLLPSVAMSGAAYLWMALLNADRRFAVAAFAPTLQPVGALLVVAVFGRRFGIESMAVGYTLGTVAQVMLLGWAASRRGYSLRLTPRWASPHMTELRRHYTTLFVGSLLMGSTTLVNQAMATMISPGAVSRFAFANVPVMFVLGLGARTVGQVLLPHFSHFAAAGEWPELRREALRAFVVTFAASAGGAAFVVVAAQPIVRILFERGAFTPEDTTAVARILRFLALQIPFYVCGIVTARLLTALQMTGHMFWIAALGLLLTVGLNLALMPWLDIAGIALAVAIVNAVCVGLSLAAAMRRLRAPAIEPRS